MQVTLNTVRNIATFESAVRDNQPVVVLTVDGNGYVGTPRKVARLETNLLHGTDVIDCQTSFHITTTSGFEAFPLVEQVEAVMPVDRDDVPGYEQAVRDGNLAAVL